MWLLTLACWVALAALASLLIGAAFALQSRETPLPTAEDVDRAVAETLSVRAPATAAP